MLRLLCITHTIERKNDNFILQKMAFYVVVCRLLFARHHLRPEHAFGSQGIAKTFTRHLTA